MPILQMRTPEDRRQDRRNAVDGRDGILVYDIEIADQNS